MKTKTRPIAIRKTHENIIWYYNKNVDVYLDPAMDAIAREIFTVQGA